MLHSYEPWVAADSAPHTLFDANWYILFWPSSKCNKSTKRRIIFALLWRYGQLLRMQSFRTSWSVVRSKMNDSGPLAIVVRVEYGFEYRVRKEFNNAVTNIDVKHNCMNFPQLRKDLLGNLIYSVRLTYQVSFIVACVKQQETRWQTHTMNHLMSGVRLIDETNQCLSTLNIMNVQVTNHDAHRRVFRLDRA